MLHIDTKYISLVGATLRNFKKKKSSLYNCSCPICGDSEKKKSKARGFFYQKGQSMFYKCHNCSVGMSIGTFLKQLFPSYHSEYLLEKYKSGSTNRKIQEKVSSIAKVKFSTLTSTHAIKISELEPDHYARKYVANRKIPEKYYSKIFFTEDFAALVDDVFPGKYSNLSKNDARLVIPFFDENDSVLGLQGRALFAEGGLRYITIRESSSTSLVYGLDRLKENDTVYVVEGPIDSLFLPNCLAAANSDLQSALEKISKGVDAVLVYDNEPRNREIVELMAGAIRSNKKVCIWPQNITQKDINDMILAGYSPENILETIRSRTFSGLSAELELAQWRKV